MLMRLVEARLKPKILDGLESIYRDKIMPQLEQIPGCVFAGLLQDIKETNQLVSLTLWESEKQVRDYVESGIFQKNLDLVTPFMEESSEWKIQLTKDDVLSYEPVKQELTIKSYPVKVDMQTVTQEIPTNRKYLRILSLNLMQGMEAEFKEIYHDEIQKELKKVNGCRYAFLIDNYEENKEMISFTIWDDLQSVELYEQQGMFKSLLEKVQHTLAELYQWKMSLESKEGSAISVTSRDIDVSKLAVVTGKKFKPKEFF